MTTFLNQSIGSFDKVGTPAEATHEYVKVWWNEKLVKSFKFHSVGMRDVLGCYHTVHGMSVEPRYVWAATKAFSCVTNVVAVDVDGHDMYVHWVTVRNEQTGEYDVEEFRLGGKYGQAVARMTKTGYIQFEQAREMGFKDNYSAA